MKKEYLIILIIAAAAAVWYFFIKPKDASNTAAANVVPPGQPQAAPVTPAVVSVPTPATNATATGASQPLTAPDVVATPAVMGPAVALTVAPATTYDSIILPWFNSLGVANKTRANNIYSQMTDAEKAALADIIANVWPGKRAQTPADTQFWNTWRVKYHVLDGTYTP